jgi:hypothetical protein
VPQSRSHTQTDNQTHPSAAGQLKQQQSPEKVEHGAEPSRQQKPQAYQEKEQRKVVQHQQQEKARQQKQERKLEQKQQEQRARELKKQQKLQAKQEKTLKKEAARQQKQSDKLQRKQRESRSHSVLSETSEARMSNSSSHLPKNSISAAHSAAFTIPSNAVALKAPAGDRVLTRDGSNDVRGQLNSKRSLMRGINQKPLPEGKITVHANGNLTLRTSEGRQYGVRANGTISSFSANGTSSSFNKKGQMTYLHTEKTDVRHSRNGQRMAVTRVDNHTTVTVIGNHRGYIERTVEHNNRTYVQRAVVVNNRVVTHTFVVYGFHGVVLTHYVSPVFYAPVFYSWVYHPWVRPAIYRWSWFGEPWYLGPNPYFVAFASYPSASFWLTDYVLSQTLAAGYSEQQDVTADSSGGDDVSADNSSPDDETDVSDKLRAPVTTPITPELKEAIADEVREQIAAENSAAIHPDNAAASYGELPSVLNERNHVFVASSVLEVTAGDQERCELQPGDVLRLTTPPSDNSPLVELTVASSRKMDCPVGARVNVSMQAVQEMQNNLREQVASGLTTLKTNQGKDGLPVAPAEALSMPPLPPEPEIQSLPNAQAVSMLETEARKADALEFEGMQSAFGQP